MSLPDLGRAVEDAFCKYPESSLGVPGELEDYLLKLGEPKTTASLLASEIKTLKQAGHVSRRREKI